MKINNLFTLALILLVQPGFAQPSGNCLNFDGVGDYVNIQLVEAPPANHSLDLWFTSCNEPENSRFQRLLSWGGNETRFEIGAMKGYFTIYTFGKNGEQRLEQTDIWLRDGKWHHVAASFGASKLTVALDEAYAQTFEHQVENGTQLLLGAWINSYDNWRGGMDELRLWKRSLSPEELSKMGQKDFENRELWAHFDFNQGLDGQANPGLTSLPDQTGTLPPGKLQRFDLQAGNPSNWVDANRIEWSSLPKPDNMTDESYLQGSSPTVGGDFDESPETVVEEEAGGKMDLPPLDNGQPIVFVQKNMFWRLPIMADWDDLEAAIKATSAFGAKTTKKLKKRQVSTFPLKATNFYSYTVLPSKSGLEVETSPTGKIPQTERILNRLCFDSRPLALDYSLWLHKELMKEHRLRNEGLPSHDGKHSIIKYFLPEGELTISTATDKNPSAELVFELVLNHKIPTKPTPGSTGQVEQHSEEMPVEDTREIYVEAKPSSPTAERDNAYWNVHLLRNDYLSAHGSPATRMKLSHGLNNLAWQEMLLGNFAQAEKYVREAIELDPENMYPRTNLPACLLFQGKYVEAEQLYREWAPKPTGQAELPTFRAVFLSDFEDFEKNNCVPTQYRADMERIKEVLRRG